MALQKNIEVFNYFDVGNSYIRISSIYGDKASVKIKVDFYFSEEECRKGGVPLRTDLYTFTPDVSDDAPNFYKQGYEYLKSLDTFTGATDVLEPGQSA